jgi:hypothetical protein
VIAIFEKFGLFTVIFNETHIEGHSLNEVDDVNRDVRYIPNAILFPPYSNLLLEEFQRREITDDLYAVTVIDIDGVHHAKRNMDYAEAAAFMKESNPMGDDYVNIYLMESAVPYADYYKEYEADAGREDEQEDELDL